MARTGDEQRVNRRSTAGQLQVNLRFCSRIPGHALHKNSLQRQKSGSTASFVPQTVYIGFRLFVLLERRSSKGEVFFFWESPKRAFSKYFPGHALHEKGLQRQIGVGTLVGSQERRALAVPLTNRL